MYLKLLREYSALMEMIMIARSTITLSVWSALSAGDAEKQIRSLGGENLLEEEMATHSSILALKMPWREEPDGLQPMCHRVEHD